MYALMDCSNFFVSCERLFNPLLHKKPVIVLSSNDGCAIARSDEVKALSIPMGAPLFKIKDLVKAHDIKIFSSNFTLYMDISQRVIEILDTQGFEFEPYSIDESFISLPDTWSKEELEHWGISLKKKIDQWLGIPVRIGFGSTKTLAKLSNELAKKEPSGVLHVSSIPDAIFEALEVNNVWGIGKNNTNSLNSHGIRTIGDLLLSPEPWLKKTFSVVMLKTVRELKGQPCFLLSSNPEPQKSMVISRSFADDITSREDLSERISIFASRAGEKLRHSGLLTKELGVFIRTSPFKENSYSNSITLPLLHHTNDTKELISHSLVCLKHIFKEGKKYTKAGIFMCDMTDNVKQDNLFEATVTPTPSNLMNAMDQLNQRYGTSSINFGACGLKVKGGMRNLARRDNLSPNYTSKWSDILTVT